MKPWWGDRRPAKLREIESELHKLRKAWTPTIDARAARKNIKRMGGEVTAEYVDTHVADWQGQAKAGHDAVGEDLRLLAARLEEIRAGYRIRLDHQNDVVGDLEAAVTHAWDRISDPDSPYYDPRARWTNGGQP